MKRMNFDTSGKLIGADGSIFDYSEKKPEKRRNNFREEDNWDSDDDYIEEGGLKKSSDLGFLKDENPVKEKEDIFENKNWNLYSDGKFLEPLKFSNGKNQEDIVKEIVSLIEEGNKVIFLHGACGTGKSAIALNIARVLGKASVVVPVKALQKQYEDDYMGKKYLIKNSGEKMKIAMITGRDNHDSLIKPGISCADPFLPENIKITDKNMEQLIEYYRDNPLIENKMEPDIDKLRRMSVAPSNPYWSPILPAEFEVNQLKDAKKIKYPGADGKEWIFYHRKEGCSYYDQYLAYKKADTIIFNAAKYKAELVIGRKPASDVEIIDEADDFLDGLFQQEDINLTRLESSLKMIMPESPATRDSMDNILDYISLEKKNKEVIGVDEKEVYKIDETKVRKILEALAKESELAAEIEIDELNYANKALEVARNFRGSLDDVYVSFRKDDDNLYVKLVSTNLSAKMKDFMSKTKAVVFMSGTLHSESIIKNVFGIDDFKVVEAETQNFGGIDIIRTGKEFDCKYSNFSSGKHNREDYLRSLSACIDKSIIPLLVQVNAFRDLPSDEEKSDLGLVNLMSSDRLNQIQKEDKIGKTIGIFKQGLADSLFTTKCSRGVDFPGDTCRTIVFTKYPNPNTQDNFWKILQRTHPNYFWEFYKDKARREFLQRIYRALRSPKDHVFILSPDLRVLNAVRDLQVSMSK